MLEMACQLKLLLPNLRRCMEHGRFPATRFALPLSNARHCVNACPSLASQEATFGTFFWTGPAMPGLCHQGFCLRPATPSSNSLRPMCSSSTDAQLGTKVASYPLVVVSFYKFADVPDYESLKEPLRDLCTTNLVSGHIILACEGINGSICGTPEAVDRVLATLQEDSRFAGLRKVEAPAGPEDELIHQGQGRGSPLELGDDAPFRWDHVRVKLKKEVVPLGVPGVNPAVKVGKYVKPKEWNDLITNADTVVIDVRNDYEVRVGRFRGAVDPRTTAFRDFPAWVKQNLQPPSPSLEEPVEETEPFSEPIGRGPDQQPRPRRVAMYCTGGIRCEKASSYLMSQGFDEVYHLEGGILRYLDEVAASDSLWEGECFVFDKRVTVEHGQKQGSYKLCYACKKPVNNEDVQSSLWEEGVSCPHCFYLKTAAEKERARARQTQYERWGKVGGPDRGRRNSPPREKREDDEPTFFFSRSL